jgi:Resolvase, N terminal domain
LGIQNTLSGNAGKTESNQGCKNPLGPYAKHLISVCTFSHIVGWQWRAVMRKRAAIYVRVSTDKQTVENQVRELRQIAERRGWEVVEEYRDAGISGAKGREKRPGLDQR